MIGTSALHAQADSTSLPISQRLSLSLPHSNLSVSPAPIASDSFAAGLNLSQGYQTLPQYARSNPSGYSFLCHLELKAENQMTVPVWIKVPPKSSVSAAPVGSAPMVQFKLFRF
ncbi:hypothetical protein [Pontibacter sp. G13]|uniref:hypothetical protein n=1 Tax=Pontibacter sp. G13 TaxID=3074898 RepID=UPI002889046B|nr:hypothetical protein [Pontibacter sp. G13]WNJ19337.1 hypothetical protein RJD25_02495 [Pontibacter sp. G13]